MTCSIKVRGLIKSYRSHGAAVNSQMEKQNENQPSEPERDIRTANSLMQSIRQMVHSLKSHFRSEEKRAALLEVWEQSEEPTLPDLTFQYMDLQSRNVPTGLGES